MSDIAAGLTALTSAISLAKALNDADKALDHAQLKLQLAEMASHLADAKLAMVDARDQVTSLEGQIRDLQAFNREKVKLVRFQGFDYESDEDGQPIGPAFCPACMSVGKLHRLTWGKDGNECPQCKSKYHRSGNPFSYPSQRGADWKPVELDGH